MKEGVKLKIDVARMEISDWSMDRMELLWKAELKSVLTISGEQSVLTTGTAWMPPWYAGNLGSQ